MKKIICILSMLLLAATTLSAQSHLEFKGVPIDGTVLQMAEKLEAQGFEFVEMTSEGLVYLVGPFSAHEAVVILVPSPKTKTAWKVRVIIASYSHWSDVKSQYDSFKENLAKKYTNAKSYEFFQPPYKAGDGYEMAAVRAGKYTWTTFFEARSGKDLLGHVSVLINKYGSNAAIYLDYEDEVNVKKCSAEQEAVYSEDL